MKPVNDNTSKLFFYQNRTNIFTSEIPFQVWEKEMFGDWKIIGHSVFGEMPTSLAKMFGYRDQTLGKMSDDLSECISNWSNNVPPYMESARQPDMVDFYRIGENPNDHGVKRINTQSHLKRGLSSYGNCNTSTVYMSGETEYTFYDVWATK